MKILVLGGGAREHALCWKLAHEPGVAVVCAPGNPGIGQVARLDATAATDIDGLLGLVDRERIDLTVVGPEAPLAAGLTDRFVAAGHRVLGPTRAAARLETSKAFAKDFMRRHAVPTANFLVCDSPEAARYAVAEMGVPVVLKADGLAAGKGVVVAEDQQVAMHAIESAMVSRDFGDAGARLVVEEYLEGQEASFFVLCDGSTGVPVGTAQDHKRVFDGDRGPNTGGMGAFAPSVLIDRSMQERIEREIVKPVLAGMEGEGAPFRGFLYVGLMLRRDGPRVIEFNVRFGDPEAQVVIPSIAEPLAPRLLEAAEARLTATGIGRVDDRFVGVVLASAGYPGTFQRGHAIAGLDETEAMQDVLVFHAGTAVRDDRLVTDGGRVLTVVGRGGDYRRAMNRAYEAARVVEFEGRYFRNDIGRKALEV